MRVSGEREACGSDAKQARCSFSSLFACLHPTAHVRSCVLVLSSKKKRAAVALAHNSVITQRTSHFFFSSFLKEKANRRKHDNRTPQGTACDYGVTVSSSLFSVFFWFYNKQRFKNTIVREKKKQKRIRFQPGIHSLSKSGGRNHVCARVRDCHHWKQKAKRAEAQPKIRKSRNTHTKKKES